MMRIGGQKFFAKALCFSDQSFQKSKLGPKVKVHHVVFIFPYEELTSFEYDLKGAFINTLVGVGANKFSTSLNAQIFHHIFKYILFQMHSVTCIFNTFNIFY